ncbi:unnamed protein product [Heterobilharzia americana]|nr:unnamed protein product [Heterobilharzia americana]
MSAESYPILYKGVIDPKIVNETILGSPVPVAHSTAGQDKLSNYHKHNQIYYNNILSPSPAFDKQTYIIQPTTKNIQYADNKECSILNINTIKGLSDSLLNGTLHVRSHSEETKKSSIENRQMKQIDTFNIEQCHHSLTNSPTDIEELKMLEEAFSDFDCDTSENTAPTRVCETFAHRVSCKRSFIGEECSEDNTTSVPSLQSTEGSCEAEGSIADVQVQNPTVSKQSPVSPLITEPSTPVSEWYSSENIIDDQKSKQSFLSLQTKQYTQVPCLKDISSILEINANKTKLNNNCLPPKLCTTTSFVKANNIVSYSSVDDIKNTLSNYTDNYDLKYTTTNIKLQTTPQISKDNVSDQTLNTQQTMNNIIDTDSLKLKDDSINQPDISQYDISCLHMSDIDDLLDMITAKSKQTGSKLTVEYDKLSSQLTKQLAAVRQVLKPTVNNRNNNNNNNTTTTTTATTTTTTNNNNNTTDSSKKLSSLNGKRSNFPVSKLETMKENIPPMNTSCSMKDNITQHSDPVQSSECINPKTNIISLEVSKLQKVPILSNTNCLIWSGAICGQIHRQHFLIKHQLDRPVTISFAIHPKSEVFKLVDENGYLITGIFRVHLPPNLEYEVNVAYVATHPVSWNFGYLHLRLKDELRSSTSKVRLIGYTNSSQLVYSCCSKLSANVYWTIASKIDVDYEINEKSNREILHSSKSHLSGCCIASISISNFGARSAWVYARVEWLDQKFEKQDDIKEHFDCGVIIEPKALVIGSKQSQNIVFTLKSGVKAARIVFYHGDEVVRYQFRQLFTESQKISSKMINKKSNCNRKDNHLRLTDILENFVHEQSIQVVELPPASYNDLRPQDWHQAIIDQVHHCERIFLYIYASSEDQTSDNSNHLGTYSLNSLSESIIDSSLPSVFVQHDAFKHRNSLNSTLQNISTTLIPQSLTRKISLQGKYPSTNPSSSISTREITFSQSPKLKLSPPHNLLFPPCVSGCSSEAYFSVSLEQSTLSNNSLWRVFWSVNPVTDVQFRIPTINSSSSIIKKSINEFNVFQLFQSKIQQYNFNESTYKIGFLSNNVKKSEFHSLLIPFIFNPLSYYENTIYQDWHLNFWLEPSKSNKFHQHEIQLDLNDSITFLVTLEGSCRKHISSTKELSSHLQNLQENKFKYSSTLNNSTLLPSIDDTLKSVRVGPLDIIGLPVTFDIINSKSTTRSCSYNIMLINRMKMIEAFVKLQLPNPPFHIIEPKETRFRILPRSRVKLVLSFQPYNLGHANSVLGIYVQYHKQEDTTTEKNNCTDKPVTDTLQINLFGTMN